MIFWQWKTCKHFVVSLVRKHIFYWKKKNCSIGVAKLWLDITVVGLCCWNSDEKWWKNWTRGLFFFFSLLGEGFQYRGGSTHTRSVTRTIHFLTRSKFLHFFGKKQRRTLLWEKNGQIFLRLAVCFFLHCFPSFYFVFFTWRRRTFLRSTLLCVFPKSVFQ